MGCLNKDYNAIKDFALVSITVKTNPNWQAWISDRYKPEVAQELITVIQNGMFDQNWGKQGLSAIISKKDVITNDTDVTFLKHRYAVAFGRVDKIGFTNLTTKFRNKLIESVLIDPNTKQMISGNDYADSGYTIVNENLFNFKLGLMKSVWDALHENSNNSFEYEYNGNDESFTIKLANIITDFEKAYISNPEKLDAVWDDYFMLKYFDQLLVDFSDFVTIKPEWSGRRYKGKDMYEYRGPYVKYDSSFNPDEFASIEQYSSAFTKALLDYLKKDDGKEAITFEGFNRAMCDLKEFIQSQDSAALRRMLYEGENTDWNTLINKYCKWFGRNADTVKILRSIQKVLDKSSQWDQKIKQVLQQQANRVVRYEFVGIRKSYDPVLKKNVVTEIHLKDSKVDKLKGSLAKRLRYRVWKSRQDQNSFVKLKNTHSIRWNSTDERFELSEFGKNGETLYLQVNTLGNATGVNYSFTWSLVDSYGNPKIIDESTLDMQKVKDLISDLYQEHIPNSYREVFNPNTFLDSNLFEIFKDTIGLTLAASEINAPYSFEFRLNGNELVLSGAYFRALTAPATFFGLINGIIDDTKTVNGLGNDLPNYQVISAIHQAQERLDLAKNDKDQFRRSIHDAKGQIHTIWDKSVLMTADGTSPVIGRAMVKADYDADGKNKNSAQMIANELNYFEIFKHYYKNLITNGKILLQPTCLSDKHTHWLIEYLTGNAKIGDETAQLALMRLTSGVKGVRDNAENKVLSKIKEQRAYSTRVEIINLLNRYQTGLGLRTTDFNAPYSKIIADINVLHEEFKKYKIDQIYKKLSDKGIDYLIEADLIELGGQIFLNETLLHNVQLYINPDDSKIKEHIQRCMLLHARNLFKNHFRIDAVLDPGLHGLINRFRNEMMPSEFNSWYDPMTQTMKAFRLFDQESNEIIPEYSKSLDYYFSGNYKVELNPILLSHFYADTLFSKEFNNIVFGEDYGLECKYLNDHNKQINRLKNQNKIIESNIEGLQSKYRSEKDVNNRKTINKAILELQNQLNSNNDALKELMDPWNEDFAYKAEASRLTMHYKRTVHGGATYTPLNQGMKYGVLPKVKCAVVNDVKTPLYSISGNRYKFTSQDGAGHSSPYFSRMCNTSYVDGAVGKNKKTIFSFVDPETGVLDLIKWAEYEITNSIRRDSPEDNEHASYETMFKKMHSEKIESIRFNNFNIQDYYNLNDLSEGVRSEPLYFTNLKGVHYKIVSITNNGNLFTRTIVQVNSNGEEIPNTTKIEPPIEIDSIYKLDQLFGGAFVEEQQDDGRLDFSEVQNDIVYRIICDLGIKDKFIGISINASALKSGQRNNNNNDIYFGNNSDVLKYFEMSTRYGGAQMNADHVLGETSVTEMSQMISALVQAGKKTGEVNKIYEFIGMVARESLGELIEITDDPNREEELYKWIGEAVTRAFQSGSTDTLGLAGAFIARAQRSLDKHGFKTKIPLSANTVRGIFEATVASIMNRDAIHRKFPGGGFVQMPTFDEKLRYIFNGQNYSYSEIARIILNDRRFNDSGMQFKDVFTDYTSLTEDQTNFKNPYIQTLTSDEIRGLEDDDTVVLYEVDEFNRILPDSIELIKLDDFPNIDRVKHLTNKRVAKWTVRPKNLLGARSYFMVNTPSGVQKYSLFDLDHARALQYAQLLLDDVKLSDEAINFLNQYIENQIYEGVQFDLTDKESLQDLKLWASRKLQETLSKISKKQEIDHQLCFGEGDWKAKVVGSEYFGSQVLIGRKEAEKFGIFNRQDLLDANGINALEFFKKSFGYLASKPSNGSVPSTAYDGVIHDSERNSILLVVDEINESKILEGATPSLEYTKDGNGHIYKGGDDLGYHYGVEFLEYKGNDGQIYTVLHANTMSDFLSFYNSTKLYTNWVPNANDNNWKRLARYIPNVNISDFGKITLNTNDTPIEIKNPIQLNYQVYQNVKQQINKLAKRRMYGWNAYKKGIGTRIPAQSMQSFTPCEIVGFTDYDTTGIHISAKLMWIQGSDLDIDKLYFMMFGFTEDGLLPTFSDLDEIFNPERVLDLPKPRNRQFNVEVATKDTLKSFTDSGYTYISGIGFELIENILNQENLNVVILDTDLTKEKWKNETSEKIDIQHFLDIHEKSKRNGNIRQIALKNTVVRRIYKLLSDPVNQYNLEQPISMDAARDAARNSRAGRDELLFNADVPSNKYEMQIANMVGRDDIGIGASSLKAFFGASTYFNTLVSGAEEQIKTLDVNNPEEVLSLWTKIKSCIFNSKFSDKRLVTFANINFEDLKNELIQRGGLVITLDDLGLIDGVNDSIMYAPGVDYENKTVDLLTLVTALDEAANGKWNSPIDAAGSLSEFISISTDNAKELVLAKINATTKFADIYTYLLSIGESFKSIADFMTSKIFYIVSDYAENNVMAQESGLWDLESVVKFVLDEGTLPIIDEKIWNNILLSFNSNGQFGGFINILLADKTGIGELFVNALRTEFGIEDSMQIFQRLNTIVYDINNVEDKNTLLKIINNLLLEERAQALLSDFIKTKHAAATSNIMYDSAKEPINDDDYDSYEDAIDEQEMSRSYNTKLAELSREEWIRYYKYLHEYVIPKNQAILGIDENERDSEIKQLGRLKTDILPALKEQRILAKILGINQGLQTQDFDEYKWIRDIEAFINERYMNSTLEADPDLEFNLIRFLEDEEYRNKQIEFYENVKSTYNVLDIIMSVPHFREMFKLVKTNRKIIEKAIYFKTSRLLADAILKVNKKISDNGLSRGLRQKLNEKEFRIIQNATGDIITRNWFKQLDGLKMRIPQDKGIKLYRNGVLEESPTKAVNFNVNTADGLASFKWMVENYIVPELKKLARNENSVFKDNEFINALQVSYNKNSLGTDVIEFLTLPFSLVNGTNNVDLEQRLLSYKTAFNTIYKESLEAIGLPEWTIGDVFYLYNLYVFKDGFGRDSLTRIFEDMIVADIDDSTLASEYLNYLRRLDSGTEQLSIIEELSKIEDYEDFENNEESDATIILDDIRRLMYKQPSAGYKFRVGYDEQHGTIKLFDKDYNEVSSKETPADDLNRSDYKFLLSSWNPVPIKVTSQSEFMKRRDLIAKKYKINGGDALKIIVRFLYNKFGQNVPIQLVTKEFIKNSGWNIVDGARGFIRNGVIYIIEDSEKITAGTPVHELMHIVCAALKYGSFEQKRQYYDLLKAVKNSENKYLQKWISEIKDTYDGVAVGSDLDEEILVNILEAVFAKKYFSLLSQANNTKLTSTSQITKTYRDFEKLVENAADEVFNPNSVLLPMTIMDIPIGEILTTLMTNLVTVETNDILKTYIPLNQQLARFKRMLVKNDEDGNQDNYLSIGGNC